jgi:hypothetical protein
MPRFDENSLPEGTEIIAEISGEACNYSRANSTVM